MVAPKCLKVWEWPLEKILKKNYTTLISIKYTTNFVLRTFPYGDFFFLTALLIAVRLNFSDAPSDQDDLLKLLSALSAVAAPSAGTLQNLCTFLGRVSALGAAMTESAPSNFKRLSWSRGASLIFQQTRGVTWSTGARRLRWGRSRVNVEFWGKCSK